MTNFLKVLVGMLAATAVMTGPAAAATNVGNTTYEQEGVQKCDGRLAIGEENVHRSPVSGIVTAFTVNPNVAGGTVAFKVAQINTTTHAIGIVGTSGLRAVMGTGLQTFATRVRIAAGDYIGVWGAGNFACQSKTDFAFNGPSSSIVTSNPAVGFSGLGSPVSNQRVLVSARVEPDADNDGFGDETQDGCKGQAGTNNGCVVATCRVPKLKGLTRRKAKSTLLNAGCKLGTVRKKHLIRFTKTQKRNRVRKQSIKAGSFRPGGTAVNITINVKKTS